ncbi:MAG: hypothetical protein ACMVO3_01270 [Thalassobaculum sp.]
MEGTDADDELTADIARWAHDLNRLHALLDRLDKEAQHLIAQRSLFLTLNDQAGDYPRSRGAWAFNLVVSNAVNAIILGLGRLWDQSPDAMSIPNAAKMLREEGRSRLLVAEFIAGDRRIAETTRYRHSDDPDEQAAWLAERMRDALDAAAKGPATLLIHREKLFTKIAALLEEESTFHVKEARHTALAHALEISREGKRRQEAGAEVRAPLIGEVIDLVDETTGVVTELSLLARLVEPDYPTLRATWDDHVADLVARGLSYRSSA